MVRRATILSLWLGLLVVGAYSADGVAKTEETPSAVATSGLVVIAHPAVTTKDLDRTSLRALLMGNRQFWSGGQKVHLVIDGREGSEARTAWIERVTGMSDVQYTQYWVGMIFRNRATTAPHAVPDEAVATALVAGLPGAISIVEASSVTDGVQVLGRVDDLLSRP